MCEITFRAISHHELVGAGGMVYEGLPFTLSSIEIKYSRCLRSNSRSLYFAGGGSVLRPVPNSGVMHKSINGRLCWAMSNMLWIFGKSCTDFQYKFWKPYQNEQE